LTKLLFIKLRTVWSSAGLNELTSSVITEADDREADGAAVALGEPCNARAAPSGRVSAGGIAD
jgi:hypothetical protein